MSLVDVSPSTVTRLKRIVAGAPQDTLQVSGGDSGVRHQEGQHGGHLRLDHSRPLGDPKHPDRTARHLDLAAGDLGERVGRANGFGSTAIARRRERARHPGNPLAQPLHRKRFSDDARRSHANLFGSATHFPGRALGHLARIAIAPRATGHVGNTAVGHDTPAASPGHAATAPRNRRPDDRRLREDASPGGGFFAHDESQVRIRTLDPAMDPREAKTRNAAATHTGPLKRRDTSCTSCRCRTDTGRCGPPCRPSHRP